MNELQEQQHIANGNSITRLAVSDSFDRLVQRIEILSQLLGYEEDSHSALHTVKDGQSILSLKNIPLKVADIIVEAAGKEMTFERHDREKTTQLDLPITDGSKSALLALGDAIFLLRGKLENAAQEIAGDTSVLQQAEDAVKIRKLTKIFNEPSVKAEINEILASENKQHALELLNAAASQSEPIAKMPDSPVSEFRHVAALGERKTPLSLKSITTAAGGGGGGSGSIPSERAASPREI